MYILLDIYENQVMVQKYTLKIPSQQRSGFMPSFKAFLHHLFYSSFYALSCQATIWQPTVSVILLDGRTVFSCVCVIIIVNSCNSLLKIGVFYYTATRYAAMILTHLSFFLLRFTSQQHAKSPMHSLKGHTFYSDVVLPLQICAWSERELEGSDTPAS